MIFYVQASKLWCLLMLVSKLDFYTSEIAFVYRLPLQTALTEASLFIYLDKNFCEITCDKKCLMQSELWASNLWLFVIMRKNFFTFLKMNDFIILFLAYLPTPAKALCKSFSITEFFWAHFLTGNFYAILILLS